MWTLRLDLRDASGHRGAVVYRLYRRSGDQNCIYFSCKGRECCAICAVERKGVPFRNPDKYRYVVRGDVPLSQGSADFEKPQATTT